MRYIFNNEIREVSFESLSSGDVFYFIGIPNTLYMKTESVRRALHSYTYNYVGLLSGSMFYSPPREKVVKVDEIFVTMKEDQDEYFRAD